MIDANNAADLTLGLRADWGTWPLWVCADDDFPEPYDVDEIDAIVPLSDELREAISAWDERFQATYNADAPQESAFASEDDEAAFIAQGEVLARRIRQEAPAHVLVRYSPPDGEDWAVVDSE